MGLVVWVCHVCACGCVCAGIDYKRRSLEINGKQLRLSIWYVLVCSCLCLQRERVGCWIWGCLCIYTGIPVYRPPLVISTDILSKTLQTVGRC